MKQLGLFLLCSLVMFSSYSQNNSGTSMNKKLQTVTSFDEMAIYKSSIFVYYSGSTWQLLTGTKLSNGYDALNVGEGKYWQRLKDKIEVPVFIFLGDQHAEGKALNSSATPTELLVRDNTFVWNNYSLKFEKLHVGVNNISNDALEFQTNKALWHGLELELANKTLDRIGQAKIYIVKCAQGGSKAEDWSRPTDLNFIKLKTRVQKAIDEIVLKGDIPKLYAFESLGTNDAAAQVSPANFSSSISSLNKNLRDAFDQTMPIIMLELLTKTSSFELGINNAIISKSDTLETFVIPSAELTKQPNLSLDYQSTKVLTTRFLDIILNKLGINGKSGLINSSEISVVYDARYALKSNNLNDLTDSVQAKTNLGLGLVNNTSDLTKPLSTLAINANLLKADLDSANFTGPVTMPKLHVVGDRITIESASPTIALKNTVNGYNINAIEFSSDNNLKVANGAVLINAGGGLPTVQINNNNGNVGIGTTTPTAKLQVVGNIKATSFTLQNASTPTLVDNGNDDMYANVRVIRNLSAVNTDGLYLGYGSSLGGPTRIFDGGTTSYVTMANASLFTTGMTKFLFGTQTDDGTAVQFASNVRVKGVLRTNSNLSMDVNNTWINMTDASGTNRRMLGVAPDNTFYVGDIDNVINTGNNLYASFGSHIFRNYITESLRITQGGFVGIGTNNPFSRLQVNGYGQPYGITLGDRPDSPSAIYTYISLTNTGNGILNIQTNRESTGFGVTAIQPEGGNVGIGTSAPTAKLEVAGSIKFGNGIDLATALSLKADLSSITAAGFGVLASTQAWTGANTFQGLTVGRGANGFISNTAFGINALVVNNGGGESTMIGYEAGKASAYGYWNTAVGSRAFTAATSGNQNVAIGAYSLFSSKTAYNNTAVGFGTMTSNLVGFDNVAIGKNALALTTGNYNVGVGSQSGNANNTGNQNTYLGYNTGGSIVSGSNNTILGANVSNLSTTMNNNIILADGQGNRKLNIDSTGNVGIGTTTPLFKLHTVGTVKSDKLIIGSNVDNGNILQVAGISNLMGNVGIGTLTPIFSLDVLGSPLPTTLGSTSQIAKFSSLVTNTSFLKIYNNRFAVGADWNTVSTKLQAGVNGSDMAYIEFNPSGSPYGLAIGTAFVESMRFIDNGYVGLGKINPTTRLDVNGIIKASAFSLQNPNNAILYDTGGDNVTANVRIIRNISTINQDGLFIGYGNVLNASTRIYDGGLSNALIVGNASILTNGITKHLFGIQTDDGTFAQFSGAVHVKSNAVFDGNVGIGTLTPTSKLQVKNGDIELETISSGIIIKSPNGTRFRLTVSDKGDIIATSL